MFAQGVALLGVIGIFFQSVAEAKGAIRSVIRLLDEV